MRIRSGSYQIIQCKEAGAGIQIRSVVKSKQALLTETVTSKSSQQDLLTWGFHARPKFSTVFSVR